MSLKVMFSEIIQGLKTAKNKFETALAGYDMTALNVIMYIGLRSNITLGTIF